MSKDQCDDVLEPPVDDDDEAPSPSASPRDKKTRRTVTDNCPIPGAASKPFSARDLLVAASPPRFINMEDVMKLSSGVTDMALAHEIAVGDNFRLQPAKSDSSSLEGRIKEVMHQAFWDVLSDSLKEDPPDYTHALVLLKEIKEGLLDLLLPQHGRLRVAIDEVLDLALIEQQAENGCLDFNGYANFVIDKMALLCAPVRDEQIAGLRDLNGVVDVYREIMATLNLMRMDMVNFTIAQFRPYVQQHSVDYERKKFQDLLELQKGNGVDGLQFTRSWLIRSAQKIHSEISKKTAAGSSSEDAAANLQKRDSPQTGPEACSSTMVSTVLYAAYLETLEWDDEHQVFPETLLMDQQRFLDLRDKVSCLTLVASVLIVTYSTVGGAISGLTDLKSKLTSQVTVLIKDSPLSKLPETITGVAEHVSKEVNKTLAERGFPQMKEEQQQLLKGQIVATIESDNTVYRLMKTRLVSFIERIMANPAVKDVQLPPGFSAVSDELTTVIAQFIRLANYNRAVFGSYYSEIISEALKSLEVPRSVGDE